MGYPKVFFALFRWPNTVFLYLYVIHRYFQTTGSWPAKIGNMEVQLKRIIFEMFPWNKYRCHGNIAGNKPALKNGLDLFSGNPVVRFYPSFVSRKSIKILAHWHRSREILTERSSVILCFVSWRFLNISSVRFQFLFAGELHMFWTIVFWTIILPSFMKF